MSHALESIGLQSHHTCVAVFLGSIFLWDGVVSFTPSVSEFGVILSPRLVAIQRLKCLLYNLPIARREKKSFLCISKDISAKLKFRICHLLALSLNVNQFYSTHR